MTAAASAHGHSHHPNYIAVFIWLVILTAIEVAIPEVVHIRSVGPNPNLPAVMDLHEVANDPNVSPERQEAAAKIAPRPSYAALPLATKIFVLSFLAVLKAALVGAFFMHLRFDGWKLNLIIAVPTMLFVVIIVLTAPDIAWQWPSVY